MCYAVINDGQISVKTKPDVLSKKLQKTFRNKQYFQIANRKIPKR